MCVRYEIRQRITDLGPETWRAPIAISLSSFPLQESRKFANISRSLSFSPITLDCWDSRLASLRIPNLLPHCFVFNKWRKWGGESENCNRAKNSFFFFSRYSIARSRKHWTISLMEKEHHLSFAQSFLLATFDLYAAAFPKKNSIFLLFAGFFLFKYSTNYSIESIFWFCHFPRFPWINEIGEEIEAGRWSISSIFGPFACIGLEIDGHVIRGWANSRNFPWKNCS